AGPPAAAVDAGADEVVEAQHLAVGDQVDRFLGERRVACGGVGDHRGGPVRVAQRGVQIVRPAGGGGVHRDRVGVQQPADRVDEVATFAGEPPAFDVGAAVPAVR